MEKIFYEEKYFGNTMVKYFDIPLKLTSLEHLLTLKCEMEIGHSQRLIYI